MKKHHYHTDIEQGKLSVRHIWLCNHALSLHRDKNINLKSITHSHYKSSHQGVPLRCCGQATNLAKKSLKSIPTGLLVSALKMIFSVLSNLLFLLPQSPAASGSSTSWIEKLDGICNHRNSETMAAHFLVYFFFSTNGKGQIVRRPGRRS